MIVFVDTSALIALLDRNEPRRPAVTEAWERALDGGQHLCTSNYVVVEALAVAQRRRGMDAVRALHSDVLPPIEVVFVTAAEHEAATAAFLAAGRRRLSFVDCASFELMRRRGIVSALALDADFAEQGFELLPGTAD